MTFDLQRILESKRVHREQIASRPLGEKLRMLDVLREREVSIRGRTVSTDSVASALRFGVASRHIHPQ